MLLLTPAVVLLLLVSGVCCSRDSIISRRPGLPNRSRYNGASPGRAGLCKFGRSRFGCCYGWKRDSYGGCRPICDNECVHGTCVDHNQCQCDEGYTGKTCERDINECSTRPCSHRCMNTPGSYRCYCEHGYLLLDDGTSCSRDDRCSKTRCSFGCIQYEEGFTCFCPEGLALLPNGLGCEDVDECAMDTAKCPPNRRCKNTYGNYMCLCPVGFKFAYVDGELDCIDDNECDANQCDPNAACQNTVGGYQCKCNEGFLGDGKKCLQVDSTTCLDNPCFENVQCEDVLLPSVEEALSSGRATVKRYRCGECPAMFFGDGETCNPATIPVQVIATDKANANTPVGEVNVRALVSRPDGQVEVVAEGVTDLNGIANLQGPTGQQVELIASKEGFVDAVKTVTVHPEGGNVVSLPMDVFDEFTTFLYRRATSKAFEFGTVGEEESNFRLSLPDGALDAPDRTTVHVNYKGFDVSSTSALASLPDLSRVRGSPNGRLLPLGAAELTITDRNGNKIGLSRPASMTFVLKDYLDRLGVRDTVDAYYFDTGAGEWVKDGEGAIADTDAGRTWTYDTIHFTFWAPALLYETTVGLTVRTCRDAYCDRPVPFMSIVISFAGSVQTALTGPSGSVCTDIFSAEINQVQVKENCTGDTMMVSRGTNTASCSDGFTKTITFQIPDTYSSSCPDPGTIEHGFRIGDEFGRGKSVSFFCDMNHMIEGNSQLVCGECGQWSGYKPFCVPVSTDSTDSADSSSSGDGYADI